MTTPSHSEARVVRGMPAAEYHAHPAVSRSDLALVRQCPALYRAKLDGLLERAESQAMRLGTLIHTAVLEPAELEKRYAAFDGRCGTKAHHAAQEANPGRELVKPADLERAQAMRESVANHPAASRLLAEGEAELSIFWCDAETGIECKCRPDWLTPAGDVVDLKTASCASPDEFARSVWRYRYDVQSAFYADGCRATGLDVRRFVFVAVEKEPPHLVAVYELDAMDAELGRKRYKQDLATLAACIEADDWPGYGDTVQPLSLPRWAYYEEQEEATA